MGFGLRPYPWLNSECRYAAAGSVPTLLSIRSRFVRMQLSSAYSRLLRRPNGGKATTPTRKMLDTKIADLLRLLIRCRFQIRSVVVVAFRLLIRRMPSHPLTRRI